MAILRGGLCLSIRGISQHRKRGALMAHLLANNGKYEQQTASERVGYLTDSTVVVCCGSLFVTHL